MREKQKRVNMVPPMGGRRTDGGAKEEARVMGRLLGELHSDHRRFPCSGQPLRQLLGRTHCGLGVATPLAYAEKCCDLFASNISGVT